MTSPDPRVGEIENRLNAATPGPWEDRVDDLTDDVDVVHDQEHVSFVASCGDKNQPRACADAEFIAHSPSDVAYLLAELRKRDEVIAKLSEWAGRSKSAYYDEAQDDVVQIIRPVLAAAKGGSA